LKRALLINVGHGHLSSDNHPRHNVAPMDLAQCAAILESAGWRVELWDTVLEHEAEASVIERRVQAKKPDLLILRPLAHTAHTTHMLGRASLSCSGIRLAMGPSAPHLAKDLLTPLEGSGAVDGVLIGEPESTLNDLLPALAKGVLPEELPGLQLDPSIVPKGRPFIRELDELPMPAQHLLVGRGYQFRYPLDVHDSLRIGYVLSSRGCALGCIFCAPAERETFGTQYRWRSPDLIVDEIARIRELGGNAVYFIDDFFAFSPKRVQALCERMIERGVILPWAAQVRAHGLSDELLTLMRRAGCSTLCFGAESGSDRVLGLLRKGVSVDKVRDQAKRIRTAGIQLVGYFIVGTPGETREERKDTYDFIEEMAPDVVQLHIFNVFPGAPAMETFPELYAEEGTKFTGPRGRVETLAELDKERRTFYLRYYTSPRYVTRTLKRRWRPLLANLPQELSFAFKSARFFAGMR
jgi:anaerobic magnesium-protoporphyrin IX monomethyl ester cyclase